MNSFKEVTEYLDSLINYEVEFPLGGSRDRPKLEPVFEAARRLKLPLELAKCIHIAGTVGKGSVAAMCQALLSARHTVLTFTSPHLVSAKERVRLDGNDLSDEHWCEGINAIRAGMATPALTLTYFETVFVFYLWSSLKLQTSAHVVETGLGGSFDATNVLGKTTAVLTKIDFDHTQLLGKTLAAIAKDKSGIIKTRMTCFSVQQVDEAAAEITRAAEERQAELLIDGRDFYIPHGAYVPLAGEFQKQNLSVAIAAVRRLDPLLTDEDMRERLSEMRLHGRQQKLFRHPNVLLDVCHNPASFAELARTLRHEPRPKRRIALVAMMKDKDARESLKHLVGAVDELWVTSAPTPRTYAAESLAEIAFEIGITARVVERAEAYRDLLELPETAQGVICGSFYLVGDFLKAHPNA